MGLCLSKFYVKWNKISACSIGRKSSQFFIFSGAPKGKENGDAQKGYSSQNSGDLLNTLLNKPARRVKKKDLTFLSISQHLQVPGSVNYKAFAYSSITRIFLCQININHLFRTIFVVFSSKLRSKMSG